MDLRRVLDVFVGAFLVGLLLQVICRSLSFPHFTVEEKQSMALNIDREMPEQAYLWAHLQEDDRVLSVGGNVGTTCIFTDKMVSAPEMSTCVEPNPATLPILRNNKRLHRSGFEILPMILSRPGGHNLSFSNMGIMAHIAKPGEPADFVLPTVDRDLSAFTVVVSDCEGCFCLLFKEFPELLRGVRLVINEIDGKCDYDFAALLRQHGFHRVDGTLPFVDGHPAHDVFSKSWFDWRKGIWSHWSQLCVTVRKLLGQPPLLVVAPLILALSATLVYLVFFSSRLGPGRDSALLTWIRTNTALEMSPVIGKSV